MKASIVAISDSDKHFITGIEEYTKRLSKKVTLHDIRPYKHGNASMIIQKDTDAVIDIVNKKYSNTYKVMMSVTGKPMDSFTFAQWCYQHANIMFIIGGPYGLDEGRLGNIIDMKISLGSLTLPHGLAKLVLLEQLYRATTIHEGKKYHY